MGDSLDSPGRWIVYVTFLAVIVAAANTRIQSSAIWICLGLWAAIVVLYLLIKLMRAKVSLSSLRTGTYRKGQEQSVQLRDKKQYLKKTVVEGSISQASTPRKEGYFKLPPLAGFSARQLQAPSNKKPRRESSSSQDAAPNKEGYFKLPPLAGFSARQLQAPKDKKPRQKSSSSQASAANQEKDFELPPLAGFAPQEQIRKKKPRQRPSPSQSYVPPGLPPELFL